jgi:hypothetical protein
MDFDCMGVAREEKPEFFTDLAAKITITRNRVSGRQGAARANITID